jgi:hypothetical protein
MAGTQLVFDEDINAELESHVKAIASAKGTNEAMHALTAARACLDFAEALGVVYDEEVLGWMTRFVEAFGVNDAMRLHTAAYAKGRRDMHAEMMARLREEMQSVFSLERHAIAFFDTIEPALAALAPGPAEGEESEDE